MENFSKSVVDASQIILDHSFTEFFPDCPIILVDTLDTVVDILYIQAVVGDILVLDILAVLDMLLEPGIQAEAVDMLQVDIQVQTAVQDRLCMDCILLA